LKFVDDEELATLALKELRWMMAQAQLANSGPHKADEAELLIQFPKNATILNPLIAYSMRF